jgi:hypothetical protein
MESDTYVARTALSKTSPVLEIGVITSSYASREAEGEGDCDGVHPELEEIVPVLLIVPVLELLLLTEPV